MCERLGKWFPVSPVDNYQTHAQKLKVAEREYVNYFAQAVNYFSGYLFAHAFSTKPKEKEQVPEFYLQFKEDATGSGQDFQDFLKHRFEHALTTGSGLWILELPNVAVQPSSQADYEQQGAGRVTLREVDTRAIRDWRKDEKGELEWIILHKKETPRFSPADERNFIVETWWIYDREAVQKFSITYQKNQPPLAETDIPGEERVVHGFQKVPVVGIHFPDGLALGEKLRAPQISNLQARFRLSWTLNIHGFPVPVINTDDKEGLANVFQAGYGICLGPEDSFGYASLPAENLQALYRAVTDSMVELFRCANLKFLSDEAGDSSKAWRTGAARMLDQNAGHITVKALGAVVREAVEKTYDLISQVRNEKLTWSVGGFEHLADMSFSDLVTTASLMVDIKVPSQTFNKEFAKRITHAALPDMPEDLKEAIDREIDSAKPEDFEQEKEQPNSSLPGQKPAVEEPKQSEAA